MKHAIDEIEKTGEEDYNAKMMGSVLKINDFFCP
jgi:hypothetical protein